MPTCPYHGGPTPCNQCQVLGMGAYAHTDDRYNRNEFSPPKVEWSMPHAFGHGHGTQTPYRVRCGVNEGLCILNTQPLVDELYTDSLIGCVQIILRSATATFTCHISSGARTPVNWATWAYGRFINLCGVVTSCYVITGDSPAIGNAIAGALTGLGLNVNRIHDCQGYSITIRNDDEFEAGPTPDHWAVSQQRVAGWQTAKDLIYVRLLGSLSIGTPSEGDYNQDCNACNAARH